MSYQNRINAEINAELDRRAADNLGWQAEFIAHAICANHDDGPIRGGKIRPQILENRRPATPVTF